VKFHIGLSVLKSTQQSDESQKKLCGIFSPNYYYLQESVSFKKFLFKIHCTSSDSETLEISNYLISIETSSRG